MQIDNQIIFQLIGGIVASGLAVNLTAQFLKKKAGVRSGAIIHTVVVLLSAITALTQYIEQIHAKLPLTILGVSGPAIYGLTQFVFKYASYGSKFANDVQNYNQAQNATASQNDSQTIYTTQVFSAPSTTSVYPTQPEQPQGFEL